MEYADVEGFKLFYATALRRAYREHLLWNVMAYVNGKALPEPMYYIEVWNGKYIFKQCPKREQRAEYYPKVNTTAVCPIYPDLSVFPSDDEIADILKGRIPEKDWDAEIAEKAKLGGAEAILAVAKHFPDALDDYIDSRTRPILSLYINNGIFNALIRKIDKITANPAVRDLKAELTAELEGLSRRLTALTAFIKGKDYKGVSDKEQGLLAAQERAMTAYADILKMRLELRK